jgi:PGF-CTERM protein
MKRRWGATVAFVAAVAVVAVAGGVAFGGGSTGIAAASHGSGDADYTVEPMAPEDRQPGATNVKYGQRVVADAGVDLRTLKQTTAVYEEGSWVNCGPDDGEIFGIDRGNTNEGYEVDESLQNNVKRFSAESDVFQVEFYGEDDFGESTYFDDGDAFISVAQCLNNPDEPGWYQISGSTTGVTESGEEKTFGGESHYFYICDCEDDAEARETLGPPPSEPEATPTPEPAETPAADNSSDGTDANTSETPAPEATAADAGTESSDAAAGDEDGSGESATAEPTPTPEPTAAPASTATPESTPTESEWDVVNTPTPGDGPGFGPLSALVALFATVSLLGLRRR